MPSLNSNLIGRINRLPKPASVADALQPLFEAISNAIQAVTAKLGKATVKAGRIDITISLPAKRKPLKVLVNDNGVGLDKINWEAFLTTDTENKIEIGGKGVGRLLWLDCFDKIVITSTYKSGSTRYERAFQFALNNSEQVLDYPNKRVMNDAPTGTSVAFSGIRRHEYLSSFPKRKAYIYQHMLSHFLPVFVGDNSPVISVVIDDEERFFSCQS